MKKIIATALTLICVLGMVGCNKDEKTVNIDFPFEIEDIENIEMYHYVGVPVSAEKKVVVVEDKWKRIQFCVNGMKPMVLSMWVQKSLIFSHLLVVIWKRHLKSILDFCHLHSYVITCSKERRLLMVRWFSTAFFS